MSSARKILHINSGFQMHRGGYLPELDLAYESWGELNAAGDNAVLLFTGLSPSAHASSSAEDPSPGWWEEMVGLGRAIDTRRFFVVCVNSLGSCFGSTGPASLDPRTERPYRLDFPVLSIEDIAAASYEVVKALGILRLHSVVGASMGGMTALAFCTLYPKAADGLVTISSAARAEPFAIALRSLQREMIRSDPAWNGGNYDLASPPVLGMRLARKLGMISYRSAEEWQRRFGRERIAAEHDPGDTFGADFEVEAYLEAHANKFIGRFDPNCYLYLSRAMDLFDVGEHSGCVATELGKSTVQRALVIGAESDFLFPIHQQEELAECLEHPEREVEFVALPSIQGHDSFLVDMDRFRPAVAAYYDRP
ncbi:MAG: homoserine O-acetyltransferase [Gammaproteobacteria bacterium]|nr:MAG: homoserine O-acetyltransferase [Gammaproteobacteria bacterium]